LADAPSLTFASTSVGSTSADSPQTVTVENVGNAALSFSAVSYPASFPESSQQTTDCTATASLPANGSCTLTIDFSPLAAGALSGSLVLTDNNLNAAAPGYAKQSIALSGTATPPPSFTLGASPASLTVIQGASGTSTIAVTAKNGFTGSVTLGASGLPTGVTAAFSPNPTTGTSVLTLTASSTAATGNTTVTIKGTSGTLSATTALALKVNPAPSFTLGASPASLTVTQGASGTSTIAVTGENGFDGKVTLSASGLPSGVTASFAPNPTAGTSALTFSASNTAVTGTYNVTIKGTSGSLTATTTIALTVNGFACHIVYTIETQWPGGFEAAITIDNTGVKPISSWTLTWTFANGQKITDIWDGAETQSGANVTVTNMSYNGSIPAGSSYTGLGFNGTWNNTANAVPTSFAVNGTTCK
jgi:hypothetical protein